MKLSFLCLCQKILGVALDINLYFQPLFPKLFVVESFSWASWNDTSSILGADLSSYHNMMQDPSSKIHLLSSELQSGGFGWIDANYRRAIKCVLCSFWYNILLHFGIKLPSNFLTIDNYVPDSLGEIFQKRFSYANHQHGLFCFFF